MVEDLSDLRVNEGARRALGLGLKYWLLRLFRLPDDVRKRVGAMIAGVPVKDLQRLSPRVLGGVLPTPAVAIPTAPHNALWTRNLRHGRP